MAEQDGLENRYTGNRIEGSNPSLTATYVNIFYTNFILREGIRQPLVEQIPFTTNCVMFLLPQIPELKKTLKFIVKVYAVLLQYFVGIMIECFDNDSVI